MIKLIFVFVTLMIFFGCSTPGKYAYYEREAIHKVEMEKLPEWFYNLPMNGDFVVGISKKSYQKEEMIDSAKQMAAITKSRNQGTFAIEKFASKDTEDILKDGEALFRLNVSSSPEEIRKIFDSLKLTDEASFFDYYIALFSSNKDLNDRFKQKYISNLPDWTTEKGVKIEDNFLLSFSKGSSYDLISAWEKAAEKARLELANYLEKEVLGMVENRNENIEKLISLETSKKISKMQITKCFVISEMKDSLLSYKVFIEMKMER
ncbi:MAG: hypothetical protein H8E57_03790 [Candidatus Cloacimonetes bacterium]|nr:hypothetical protein [Candidatus Cloacimonadota bacterium]